MVSETNGVRAKWYVVTTQSGKEKQAAENIMARSKSMGEAGEKIKDALVVEEEVPVLKKGEPTGKTRIKNKFPRFIFVSMVMDDDSWFVVRNTPDVTGIVGSSGKGTKPTPVPEKEMSRILRMSGKYVETNRFEVGDRVKILAGEFQTQIGTVKEVLSDSNQVRVELMMMGTFSLKIFPYTDVEKVDFDY